MQLLQTRVLVWLRKGVRSIKCLRELTGNDIDDILDGKRPQAATINNEFAGGCDVYTFNAMGCHTHIAIVLRALPLE